MDRNRVAVAADKMMRDVANEKVKNLVDRIERATLSVEEAARAAASLHDQALCLLLMGKACELYDLAEDRKRMIREEPEDE